MRGSAAAARGPGWRKAPASRRANGLTLLEMLVVFVLASLVGTLLIQGAGFFLGQYDTVKRIGREASSEALQQRWFASTVRAMVPYLAEDRRFEGESNFFQGITMQPLRATPGIPAAARWSIVAGESGAAVVYAEQLRPCKTTLRPPNDLETHALGTVTPPGRSASDAARTASDACDDGAGTLEDTHWTVLESDDALAFEYAGLDRVWRQRWPVEGVEEWIPRQVRLVSPAGQTLLTASFDLHFEPIGNPRDFR